MFGLGSSFSSPINWRYYALGQVLVTAAQLTAHYVNEYADYEADKRIVNRTAFSGGSGVLSSGRLDRRVALWAARMTSLVALIADVAIVFISPAAAVVGLLALAVSWAYSMPPIRLLSTGFGELATAVTVAGFVPLIGALLQGNVPSELWWLMTLLVLLQMAMLLTFELPDVATDALAEKRVLAVRLGDVNTIVLIAGLIGAGLVVSIASVAVGSVSGELVFGAIVAAPTAVGLLFTVGSKRYGMMTFCGVATFFLCGCGLLLAQ